MEASLLLPQRPSRENCLIRNIFIKNLNQFYAEKNNSARIPQFVKKEVADFLKCGILAHGFVRLYCRSCESTQILAFSCKRRGFCPSCCARRMNDTAIHLEENVFPREPVRQWVLSFPFFIRYLMAYDPRVVTAILRIHTKVISNWYERQSRVRTGVKEVKTGSVTVVQRFGGALNINPHFHSLFLDGSYYKKDGGIHFREIKGPTQKDQERILKLIIKKIIRWLTKRAYLEGEYIGGDLLENSISDLHGQSVVYRIAVGNRAGEKIQLHGYELESAQRNSGGGISLKGFNIHAQVCIKGDQRERLQILFRYVMRGPLSRERIEPLENGKVAIRFKKKWSNGMTHAIYTNVEFIEKLVALVPPARANLVRYHGVFAPNSKWRSEVVPPGKTEKKNQARRTYRLLWAELMRRTFGVDPEKCKKCGYKLEAIAIIVDSSLVQSILESLEIKSQRVALTAFSSRGPPRESIHFLDQYSQAPDDW